MLHTFTQNTAPPHQIQALEQRYASELQLIRLETDAAEAATSKRLADHQQLQGRVSTLESQLRKLRRGAEDAAVQLRAAREEAAELRAAKEAAVVEREQGLIRGERMIRQLQVFGWRAVVGLRASESVVRGIKGCVQLKQLSVLNVSSNRHLQAEVSELQHMSETLTRKARHLQTELDESTRAQEAMHDQMLALQSANATLSAQLLDAKAVAARECQLAADKAAAAERQWGEKIRALMQECLDKDRKLAESSLQKQDAIAHAVCDAEARAATAEARAAEVARGAAEREGGTAARVEAAEQAAAGVWGWVGGWMAWYSGNAVAACFAMQGGFCAAVHSVLICTTALQSSQNAEWQQRALQSDSQARTDAAAARKVRVSACMRAL